MNFNEKVERELDHWERRSVRPSSLPGKLAKNVQNKINEKIPEKFHQIVTSSVKQMMRATIIGSDYMSDQKILEDISLEEREKVFAERMQMYKRTAAVEGAGTGFGGIFLGIADFPLLLTIKMKFLFDTAKIYGYDVSDYRERLFLLHVFKLAFSKDEKKKEAFETITSWEKEKDQLPSKKEYLDSIDWKTFQLEYRDFIDLPKTLQLIPGFGAIVGAVANYQFIDLLGDTAKNAYRHRYLKQG